MHPRFAFHVSTVSTLKTLTTWMCSGRIRGTVAILLLIFAIAPHAAAYTQNTQLERDLGNNDPKALALLPAKGFKDGAAGFFQANSLYVVPDSQRAWCSEHTHGILKPGCYVELFVQGEGIKPRNSRGEPCGAIGRWYKAPGSSNYVPTIGTFISNAMANGDWDSVVFAIYEGPGEKNLPTGACNRTIDQKLRRN
jgi:hypothetical protein